MFSARVRQQQMGMDSRIITNVNFENETIYFLIIRLIHQDLFPVLSHFSANISFRSLYIYGSRLYE